ncbi:hypothetical protein FH972_005881 [Carpinus fangiana]|uniref:Uncharacterized protein n=1 Tax=Carpinus fangiana TaxID=176857 RepID=A0A5N6QQX7_9ROSI|nr:hypothetical protein FH972_005881 [Carpinus fangiana]
MNKLKVGVFDLWCRGHERRRKLKVLRWGRESSVNGWFGENFGREKHAEEKHG